MNRAELTIREVLGDYIVGIDEETLASTTARILTNTCLTLSLAESCTGGLIAKLLTDQAGSSRFLERGIVSYANSAKINCLDVPPEILDQHGAVSEECARAMVRGVYKEKELNVSI